MQVPFARPYFRGDEGAAVAEAIASGWVSQGPRVREFEAAFAERVGAPHAVATTSCTSALHLALYGLGVRPGDEVIVPSLSFIATANAVWQCGATPVFADVERDTYNIDPQAVERAITPRTKLIMPVHQIGLPADMDPLMEIAERHGIGILEDAACAIGATYKGRQIGAVGPIACFSLHPRKVITTGEGGMITLHDAELAEHLRHLRQHAMSVSDLARHNTDKVVIESYPERGFNYRMTDMQAALGLCQLEILEEVLERRRELAERYNAALAHVPYIETPYEPPYATRTWQSYCVRVGARSPLSRTALMQALLDDGVVTRKGVMAIHEEQAYAGQYAGLAETETAAAEAMMLPLFPGLTFEQQDYVIDRLAEHVAVLAA
jgi:dTDP-4-amino-4,6-dideoxygalactose transaminase